MTAWASERVADRCVIAILAPGQHLQFSGRLDVHTATDLRFALVTAVATGTGELVVDLSQVQALDASGLGVLVGAHRRADRAGRTLVLTDCSAAVVRVLFLTRLERVLHTRAGARLA